MPRTHARVAKLSAGSTRFERSEPRSLWTTRNFSPVSSGLLKKIGRFLSTAPIVAQQLENYATINKKGDLALTQHLNSVLQIKKINISCEKI
jgi:hypothetical protein